MFVEIESKRNPINWRGIAGSWFDGTEDYTGSSWHWAVIRGAEWDPVIRYRIRKPRGLVILETLLTSLPEDVDA
jgi:hypothetical protein